MPLSSVIQTRGAKTAPRPGALPLRSPFGHDMIGESRGGKAALPTCPAGKHHFTIGGLHMTLAAMLLWAVSALFVSIMLLRGIISYLRSAKMPEKPGRLLSFREEKLWLCGLVLMLLAARYFIVHAFLFQDGPDPALSSALFGRYLQGLLFSFLWPAQLFQLIGTVVFFFLHSAWKRKNAPSRTSVVSNKSVFIGVCAAFLLLTTAAAALWRLDRITLSAAYTTFLVGKCIALVCILMSASEKAKGQDPVER